MTAECSVITGRNRELLRFEIARNLHGHSANAHYKRGNALV